MNIYLKMHELKLHYHFSSFILVKQNHFKMESTGIDQVKPEFLKSWSVEFILSENEIKSTDYE